MCREGRKGEKEEQEEGRKEGENERKKGKKRRILILCSKRLRIPEGVAVRASITRPVRGSKKMQINLRASYSSLCLV